MRTMLLALVISFALAGLGCDKGGDEPNTTPKDTLAGDTGCTPDCDGKQCGDDGCGGTCGECQGDDSCTLGVCTSAEPVCGNEVCEPPEGPEDCPEDCGDLDDCGDEFCIPPETPDTCPADCATETECGDEICTPPETPETCPADCDGGLQGCADDADCELPNMCPQGAAMGCICSPGSDGGVCMPICETDDDCPVMPDANIICGQDGLCVPDEDILAPCNTDADCEQPENCFPDASKGCTCVETPDGKLCIPICSTDDDCPEIPGMNIICGQDGICGPAGDMPPG